MIIFKNKFAFTLAEVLITLGIIGVVAALTIPTLINNASDKSNRVALKKYYNILSNATELIKSENSGTMIGLCPNNNCFRDLYKQKLSYIRECSANDVIGKCWSSSWKTLNNVAGWDLNNNTHGGASGLILKDGIFMTFEWAFDNGSGACTLDDQDIGDFSQCFVSSVDVNGQNGPNQMGKDIFRFYVYKDKVKPIGTPDQTGNLTDYPCIKTGRGDSCSASIINDINFVIPN